MTAIYDGNTVLTPGNRPWQLPEVVQGVNWASDTEREVWRAPRPAEPARWLQRWIDRGSLIWVDADTLRHFTGRDDTERTTRTKVTKHRQTRTVTPWADVEATLPMEAIR